jgi:hypothetical protein
MTQINWRPGSPPDKQRDKRLLLIATPISGVHDAAADNRPNLYVGHFQRGGRDCFVPARGSGMGAHEPRPDLQVLHCAEIDLPSNVELRGLTIDDFEG